MGCRGPVRERIPQQEYVDITKAGQVGRQRRTSGTPARHRFRYIPLMLAVQPEGVIILLLICVWFGLAFVCAKVAADKGRSAGGFFVLGLFFPVITLIVCLVMQPQQFQQGSVVQLATDVHLDDGTTLQRGFRTKIADVSVIDNTRVVSITDQHGRQRWVAAKAVRLST